MTISFIWTIPTRHLNCKTTQLLEGLNLSLILILKTYFSWILSVSHLKPHAILKINLFLNSRDNWMTSTRCLLKLKAQPQPLSKLPGMTHTTLSVLITTMAIQCNQFPIPSHNSALPQFLTHHNCKDLDPTDTPSSVPTAFQAPNH